MEVTMTVQVDGTLLFSLAGKLRKVVRPTGAVEFWYEGRCYYRRGPSGDVYGLPVRLWPPDHTTLWRDR